MYLSRRSQGVRQALRRVALNELYRNAISIGVAVPLTRLNVQRIDVNPLTSTLVLMSVLFVAYYGMDVRQDSSNFNL